MTDNDLNENTKSMFSSNSSNVFTYSIQKKNKTTTEESKLRRRKKQITNHDKLCNAHGVINKILVTVTTLISNSPHAFYREKSFFLIWYVLKSLLEIQVKKKIENTKEIEEKRKEKNCLFYHIIKCMYPHPPFHIDQEHYFTCFDDFISFYLFKIYRIKTQNLNEKEKKYYYCYLNRWMIAPAPAPVYLKSVTIYSFPFHRKIIISFFLTSALHSRFSFEFFVQFSDFFSDFMTARLECFDFVESVWLRKSIKVLETAFHFKIQFESSLRSMDLGFKVNDKKRIFSFFFYFQIFFSTHCSFSLQQSWRNL